MRVVVDPDRCNCCGICVEICPNLFEIQDDTVEPVTDIVPTEEEDRCQEAAEACPEEAIILEE